MSSTNTIRTGAEPAAEEDDVIGFADAVRRELDDLAPEEIDDLVDGLEADLIERAEDSGEPLGDPAVYAAELRAAAGLPPRSTVGGRGEWFGGYTRLRHDAARWITERRERPAVAAVLDFLMTLRPVWWVLRGWVIFQVAGLFGTRTPFPDDAAGWLFLLGVVVVSVQWGRGRWLPWPWLRGLMVTVSVIAILVLPVLAGQVTQAFVAADADAAAMADVSYAPPALVNGKGNQITNVFPFDCDGNPLEGVQLFDQDGEPLEVGDHGPEDEWMFGVDEEGNEIAIVPNPDVTTGTGWNVFPLRWSRFDETYQADASAAEDATAPFEVVQPLADSDGTCPGSPAGTDGAGTDGAGTDGTGTDGTGPDGTDGGGTGTNGTGTDG